MAPTVEEAKSLAAKVEGWLDDREGELLYTLARQCRGKGVIVEVGSWKGKSTIWLASGSKAGRGAQVYAIDPHTGSPEHRGSLGEIWTFDEFNRNIRAAGLGDLVVPIVKTSREAALSFDHPVELIFVDGAHEYEAVKQDFELWFPKLIDGAVIAFHDTGRDWPGPYRLVWERLYTSRNFRTVYTLKSITYAQKTFRNTLGEWLRNSAWSCAKNVVDGSRNLKWPKLVKDLGRRIVHLAGTRIVYRGGEAGPKVNDSQRG